MDKLKKSVGLSERPVEPRLEVVEERGITRSKAGTILFGSARNALSSSVSEGNLSEHASEMAKRAGWVNQNTVGLYLKDETPPLEEGESAEISALREDRGGDDNDIPVTSASEDCHKMDDDATDATAVESFGADSINPSDGNSSCASTQWSMTVNGTLYIGNVQSERRPETAVDDKDEIVAETPGETTKERNRRLLTQHRESQRLAKVSKPKHSGKHRNYKGKLREIKEEAVTAETVRRSTEGDGGVRDNNSDEKNPTEDERRQQMAQILRKRTKSSQRVGRFRRQNCGGSTKRTRPRVKIVFGSWVGASWRVEDIIRLYSCSAFRYAMFKSNRRYKPGD